MSLQSKITVGLFLTAGSISSSWGGHALTRPKNVLNQLSKEKKSLLNLTKANSSSKNTYIGKDEWEKILNLGGSSEEAKSFANWDDSQDTENYQKINKIKEKCRERLKVAYSDNNFWNAVSDARKFCTKTTK